MKQAMLACVLAAVPYVPIDRSTPAQRVQTILRQVRPQLLIGDFADAPCPQILPESLPNGNAAALAVCRRDVDDVCYILFTSGSTGVPKGVCVSYGNVDTCARWLRTLPQNAPDCVLGQASFSFDLSVADLVLSLAYGAEHAVLTREEMRSFPLLFHRLAACGADTAVWTPSFAELLLTDRSFSRSLLPRLRTILFCGEALRPTTARKLMQRFPETQIVNCYGPTECTFAVTAVGIAASQTDCALLPAGKPKPGVRIDVTDARGNPLPEGETGEIRISGDSVALGYLPPAQNDAFLRTPSVRTYRTGDYGYFRGGLLYVTGRRDRQIKLNGYRVELAEVENALLSLPQVHAAAVLPRTAPDGTVLALQAFVVAAQADRAADRLRQALAALLPSYMIPRIRFVERIPLTENGKLDTKALWETPAV
jgi:D-alanine--poly(phosphoribitol) ligase subunit 1